MNPKKDVNQEMENKDVNQEMENTAVEFDPFRHGEIARVAPSTEPQREIITSAQMSDEANTAFNEAVSLRIAGNIEPAAIEAALRTIVDRHDALRMTFTRLGDELCVTDRNNFRLERIDLGSSDRPAQEEAILGLWRQLISAPMDLEEGSLFRALWIPLEKDLGELILLTHHIVCDGWSFYVILDELSQLCSGIKAEALPAAPSYADFAERLSARAVSNADVDFWVERFESKPPILDLPTDRPRPPFRSFAAERIDHRLDRDLVKAISVGAGKLKASVVNVALAGTAALLHRLTDVTDMAIGLPVARQSSDGMPGLVGHAVQLLPIRLQIRAGESFGDLIRQAKTATLDAREHFDFTFGTLIQNLKLSGDPSRVPLVSVIFNIDQPFGTIKLGSATATLRTVPRTAENFEIFLNVLPEQDNFTIEATYNTGLFSAETIRSWLCAFESLLTDGVADPSKPVSALSLSGRRPEIYERLNDTARSRPPGLWLDRFQSEAAKHPDAVAVVGGKDALTYAELARRSDDLAQVLLQRGVARGSIVGIYMTRSCELMVALAAVHRAGAAYLPLDPSFPEARLAFMLSDSGARLLLTDLELPAALAAMGMETLVLPQTETTGGDTTSVQLPKVVAADLAYLIYTSGSTGKPKGVEVMHGGVTNLLDSMGERPGFGRNDTLLAVTTLSFDISVLELFLPLTRGGRVVIATRDQAADPAVLAELLQTHRVNVMQATPSTWRLLLNDGWAGSAALVALCGGEPLPADLATKLLGKVKALWNMYGPTETTIWSTCEQIAAGADQITVGSPIDNTVIYVLDETGQAMPPAIPGEIAIGGAGVARSYHGRPDLTAARFIEHPQFGRLYRTGDRGRLLPRGVIEHLGRLDFQVKVRGFRIELGEIEAGLGSHPDIVQAVVITREDHPGDVRLVAYLVARSGAVPADDALRIHLKTMLPDYMIPQHFVALPSIPLLPNGKLNRGALPTPDTRVVSSSAYVGPRTELERSVVKVMEDVLSRNAVGIHDSFFALGGHSLLAAQVSSNLSKAVGSQIPMRALFEAPTAAQLANWIEERSKTRRAPRLTIPRRPDRRTAPLSLMQERIWFLEQLDPGRGVYNVPAAHRLRGKLDEAEFSRAFSELVRRQESLRTVFTTVDSSPVQVILPEVQCGLLPVEDLRTIPGAEREQVLRERLVVLIGTPFDLTKPPLFCARLFRLDDEEYAFFFMTHHIVWDGWSFDLVYKEMAALYDAFSQGRPSPLPELTIAYGDFAAWHREWMQGEELAAELAHWKDRLAGQIEPLAVPTDYPRPPRMSGNGRTTWISLPGPTVERIRALGQRADATVFMALLAAHVLLLHQFTGQREIVVGTPFRGRQVAELESMMGFFVNVLPIRFRVAEDVTFLQLLKHVRDCIVDAFKHPDVPFEHLVRELKIARDESRFPICQTMFSFQDARGRVTRWGNLDHSRIPVMQQGAIEDIGLWFVELNDRLTGGLSFNTDILSEGTAQLLRDRFIHIVEASLAQPDIPIAHLPLPDAELRRLAEWNATVAALPSGRCFHDLIAEQAVRTPDAVAVVSEGRMLSYQELDRRANQLAHALRKRRVGPDVMVGLCVNRTAGMIVALLGILKAGGAYVPLDPEYPAERLAFMLQDSDARVLVTEETLKASLPPLPTGCDVLYLDRDAETIAAEPQDAPRSGVDLSHLAYAIYTSGSTGQPKAALLNHLGLLNLAVSEKRLYGIGPHSGVLQFASLSFDTSLSEIAMALCSGATLYVEGRNTILPGPELERYLEREKVTVLSLTPSALAMLDPAAGPSLEQVIVGGESCPAELAKLWAARCRFFNAYGPTEATVTTTCVEYRDGALPPNIGQPLPNVRVYVLDPALRPVPIGVYGELYIGGVGVARGYFNRPQLESTRFLPDPFRDSPGGTMYRTGDFARWRVDGQIDFIGRMDDQLKIRGFRIELGEIESVLAEHPDVRQAAVRLWTVNANDVRMVACCVPAKAGVLASMSLRKHLRARLPEHMIPQHFLPVEEIPLTPNDKIDRSRLPTPAVAESRLQQHEAPADPIEATIAEIWANLIGPARPIGRGDRFFEMGGHSLLALRALGQTEQKLGVKLEVRILFQESLAEIAARCRSQHAERSGAGLLAG
ncbi:MAG: amino acid adenylation domain-containing protein [Burkholderiales bacterium]